MKQRKIFISISLNNNFKDAYINKCVYQENDEIDEAVSVLKNILKMQIMKK